MHNRLVWASLSGCLPPLLSMATRTTDRLWSMANCALIHMFVFNAYFHIYNFSLNETINGVSLQESPKTIESIFGEITTVSNYSCVKNEYLGREITVLRHLWIFAQRRLGWSYHLHCRIPG